MSRLDAIRRFAAFRYRQPSDDEIVRLQTSGPVDALVIGELEGIIYNVEGEPRSFIHKFRKNARPLLLVSSDGRQIYTLMGAYEFTERGFVG